MFSKTASASKKKNEQVPAIHTLLGKETLWKGEIHGGTSSIRIEGSLEGTIHSEGEVTIAPSGIVNGTIHAKHLIVTGKAAGILKIAECLEIHGTGWVEGDVEVGSLVVDEGGTLLGNCTRRGMKESAPLPPPMPPPEPKPETKPEPKPEPKHEDRFHGRPLTMGPSSSAQPPMDHPFTKPFEPKGKS